MVCDSFSVRYPFRTQDDPLMLINSYYSSRERITMINIQNTVIYTMIHESNHIIVLISYGKLHLSFLRIEWWLTYTAFHLV